MSKWDRRMLSLVGLVASWSKDPSTKVGAAIVDKQNRIVSLGFNGFPRAVSDSTETLVDRDEKLRRTIHAEENAILFAGRPVMGCTIYVTHPPCARCAAKIIQSGITRVISNPPSFEFRTRWADDMHSALSMFAETHVSFEWLDTEEAQPV